MGTVPNARGNIHAFDLRMMVGAEPGGGFFPVAIYARRARRALPETLVAGASSWDILGTNLSIKARARCPDGLLCVSHSLEVGVAHPWLPGMLVAGAPPVGVLGITFTARHKDKPCRLCAH